MSATEPEFSRSRLASVPHLGSSCEHRQAHKGPSQGQGKAKAKEPKASALDEDDLTDLRGDKHGLDGAERYLKDAKLALHSPSLPSAPSTINSPSLSLTSPSSRSKLKEQQQEEEEEES